MVWAISINILMFNKIKFLIQLPLQASCCLRLLIGWKDEAISPHQMSWCTAALVASSLPLEVTSGTWKLSLYINCQPSQIQSRTKRQVALWPTWFTERKVTHANRCDSSVVLVIQGDFLGEKNVLCIRLISSDNKFAFASKSWGRDSWGETRTRK